MNEHYRWNLRKAAANRRDHGIAFEEVGEAFRDPFAVEWIDDREEYGEERINLLAMCGGILLHVTYTERGDHIRLISHGGQNDMNKTDITAKIRPDGRFVQHLEDGREQAFPPAPPRPMTEAEVSAAAAADPDARPMTEAEMRRAPQVPRVKTLRRALALTQEEFATRYHIPLGTLRDWEQGRVTPDQPTRAYLTVIARDPDGVRRALDMQPG